MEESELIDKYIKGELSLEEMESFFSQLQVNNELRKKVALRKIVVVGIGQAYADELKSKLIEFDHSLEKKNRFQFSWKMAAAFTVVAIAGSILYLTFQKTDPLKFDIPEPGFPNVMGAAHNIELNNAMSIFKAESYVTATEIFEKLLENQSENDTIIYFSALCNFRIGKSQQAIEEWKRINATSEFYRKTQYRLAIAYWLQGDENKAIELLQSISNDKSDSLKEEAQNALDAIN